MAKIKTKSRSREQLSKKSFEYPEPKNVLQDRPLGAKPVKTQPIPNNRRPKK